MACDIRRDTCYIGHLAPVMEVRSLFYFLGSVCSTNWDSSLFYRGCSLFYREGGVCSTKNMPVVVCSIVKGMP